MRLSNYFCVLVVILGVTAQRRLPVQDTTKLEQPSQKPILSRGRARFTQTSEFSDFVQSTDDPTNVKKSPRRRLDYERHLQPRFEETTANRRSGFSYEVSETLDDIPRNDFPRQRSKVITETSYEAKNAFRKESAQELSSTTILTETSAKLEKEETPSTVSAEITASESTAPANLFSPETTSTTEQQKIKAEPTKIDILPTEEPRRKLPRDQLRSRLNTRVEEPTTTTVKSRIRPNRRQQATTTTTVAPEIRSRTSRRRPESRTNLNIEKEQESPSRSRTGRRTDTVRSSRRSDSSEENLEVRDVGRRKLHTAQSRRTETKVAAETEVPRVTRTRGRGFVRANTKNLENTEKTPLTTTFGSRKRTSRTRVQPVFDETKLEVLPLFESENKTEKITAVDNIPEISSSKLPESTSPLTTSSEHTTLEEVTKITDTTTLPNGKTNRRFPSRPKEIKSNKLEEPRRNSRRYSATTTENSPVKDIKNNRQNFRTRSRTQNEPRETTTRQSFKSRNSPEITTEKIRTRKFERVKPKRVEPTLSENRLQTLTPKRPGRRRDPIVSSTDGTTTHRGRTGSRFNEKEDLAIEEGAESNMAKSIEKLSDEALLKHSRNAKRGTGKDHSVEESVEESDNYPEPFKALLQAKAKLKESRSKVAEESLTSSTRIVSDSSLKNFARDSHRDTDNDLEKKPIDNTTLKPRHTTQPTYTATTKEVKTSVSSKVTVSRQRYHARYKANGDKTDKKANKTQNTTVKVSTIPVRNLTRSNKPRLPPKNIPGVYNKKNTVRSTVAPEVEVSTAAGRRTSARSGIEQTISTSEIPQVSAFKPKGHRFSARYRSDILRATGFKATTAPAYLPTVPTVTPGISTTTATAVITEENELGMEIISLDEPTKTSIPSANLIRDDFISSTIRTDRQTDRDTKKPVKTKTVNNLTQVSNKKKLNAITSPKSTNAQSLNFTDTQIWSENIPQQKIESDSQVSDKKPSLIEQIINSLTHNSLTPSSVETTTTTTQKPTTTTQAATTAKSDNDITQIPKSTIQKIPKKDQTATQDIAFGTPRSIIDRILNSISSIQSVIETTTDSSTERLVVITKRPQKSSSTVSSTTKRSAPVKYVQKSVTVIPPSTLTTAQASTLDPIRDLDKDTTENSLRKRTLSTLISLLNLVTTPATPKITTPKTVVVTPKVANTPVAPTNVPQKETTANPTTNMPTKVPTMASTIVPTKIPPTMMPTQNPTTVQTKAPTTNVPTTEVPTRNPTTKIPTTNMPTTNNPTRIPTKVPTTSMPTMLPTQNPTKMPTTNMPTMLPIQNPTKMPTTNIPTTNNPIVSTQNPTTKMPTTNMPTTMFPTAGTTKIPTTNAPTTNMPTNPTNFPTTNKLKEATTIVTPVTDIYTVTPIDLNTIKYSASTISSKTESPTTLTSEEGLSKTELFDLLNRFAVNLDSVRVSSPNDITIDYGSTTPGEYTTEGFSTVFNTENVISELPFDIISTTKSPVSDVMDSSTVSEAMDAGSTLNPMPVEATTLDISSNTIENVDNKDNLTNIQNSQGGDYTPRFKVPPTIAPIGTQSSTSLPDKDFYLFAILPNNTVVRKRPSMYPTKETPYLIYGIYPNNTIVRKFPNGTVVPEEPLIQVRGFDTSANPPDITSNQVTTNSGPVQQDNTTDMNNASDSTSTNINEINGNSVDNKNTFSTSTRFKTLEVDPLTNMVVSNVLDEGNVVFRWKPVTSSTTDGNKIDVDVNVIASASSTQSSKVSASTANPNSIPDNDKSVATGVTTTATPITTVRGPNTPPTDPTTMEPSTMPPTMKTTTEATTEPSTMRVVTQTPTKLTTEETTVLFTRRPTTIRPTTAFTTAFTTPWFTTLWPSTVRPTTQKFTARPTTARITTKATTETTTEVPTEVPTTVRFTQRPTTIRITTQRPTTIRVTTQPTTVKTTQRVTQPPTRRVTTVPTTEPTVASTQPTRITVRIPEVTPEPSLNFSPTTVRTISSTLKQLTEEQRKNLETLAALEKEQAAILKQLSFLTNLIPRNGGNDVKTTPKPALGSVGLAQNIISLGTVAPTTPNPLEALQSLYPNANRIPKKIQSDTQSQLENILKQYDMKGINYQAPDSTPSPKPNGFGKSNDALLAQLLKEQGIKPTTPRIRILEQLQSGNVPPRATTPRPGPLTRGLNWVLNNLLGPAQPTAARKPKPQVEDGEDGFLSRQPTRVTPVIYDEPTTAAPLRSTRPPRTTGRANAQANQDLSEVLKVLQKAQNGKPSTPQEEQLLKQIQQLQSNPNLLKNLEAAFGKKFVFSDQAPAATTRRTTTTTTTTTTRPTTTTTRPTTRITTRIPKLSQDDIAYLIKQIQAVQEDPNAAKTIDISKLIGRNGRSSTERYLPSTTAFPDDFLEVINNRSPTPKATRSPKYEPVYQSSPKTSARYKDDDYAPSSATPKQALPPVAFRPVNGVPEGEGMLRSRLVNAAVTVTRSISRFFSSALQSFVSSGSRGFGSLSSGS